MRQMLILTIGISGSGKSTWARRFARKYNCVVISTDLLRKELTGNVSDQSRNYEIDELARTKIMEGLERGRAVIFDATNCYTEKRRTTINRALEKFPGISIKYKLFPNDVDLSHERVRKDIMNNIVRSNVSREVILDQEQRYLATLKDIQEESMTPLKWYDGIKIMIRNLVK